MDKDFLIIAHRGESFDAPENTLASINLAWERDDDAVEIDVQMTKDKKIVVIHDKSTLRTGGTFKRIASNYYSGLTKVDVGLFKGTKFNNEKIPLLDEVIDSIPEGKILFVEIKTDEKIVKPLVSLLANKNIKPSQIKFIGFGLNTMKLIKQLIPQFEVYWITGKSKYKNTNKLKAVINKCKSAGLNGLDVEAGKYLNEDVIQLVKKNGLKIYTWTVDDPVRGKQLLAAGINGITTNRASWMKRQMQNNISN